MLKLRIRVGAIHARHHWAPHFADGKQEATVPPDATKPNTLLETCPRFGARCRLPSTECTHQSGLCTSGLVWALSCPARVSQPRSQNQAGNGRNWPRQIKHVSMKRKESQAGDRNDPPKEPKPPERDKSDGRATMASEKPKHLESISQEPSMCFEATASSRSVRVQHTAALWGVDLMDTWRKVYARGGGGGRTRSPSRGPRRDS